VKESAAAPILPDVEDKEIHLLSEVQECAKVADVKNFWCQAGSLPEWGLSISARSISPLNPSAAHNHRRCIPISRRKVKKNADIIVFFFFFFLLVFFLLRLLLLLLLFFMKSFLV